MWHYHWLHLLLQQPELLPRLLLLLMMPTTMYRMKKHQLQGKTREQVR